MVNPGAYANAPAWWNRERWRSELWSVLHSDGVTALRANVGTRGRVSVRAIFAVAVAISAAADGATGRNALPGNAALTAKPCDVGADAHASRFDTDTDTDVVVRLAASSGYGLTTVQKAVQVLTDRGWLVLMRAGKNRLTAAERMELWQMGVQGPSAT